MFKFWKWLFNPDWFILSIGGGGGSPPPASQTQVADLPEWAKPYAKETLGKAQALTDVNQNPYQTYGGERIAGFTPMQQQAQAAAGQMQPSQLGAQAGQMAGAATYGALGTTYDPYRMGEFTSGRAAQYMNPFVEMAMEPQLREAQRSSEMQRMADQAQAVRAGAFGGGRQAIVEAERQRNLGTQLGDIRARGYMSAFDQAQQNFAREQQMREQSRQYGAGLGLQGLQTALQGAGQMGQLGQTEFGQRKDIMGLQAQFGEQQQQLEQQRLGQQYQDFMNQQRYPYQQLEFMSNILRGTPMGTVQTMYQAPPSAMQNLASLGLGAYGAKQLGMFAKGGSVTDEDNVEDIVDSLSDAQLAQARQAAMLRGDGVQLQAIAREEAMRASERRGVAGMYNALPRGVQARMAGGGIVAFAGGGNPDSSAGDDDDNDGAGSDGSGEGYVRTPGGLNVLRSELEGEGYDTLSPGSPTMHALAAQRALGVGSRISRFQPTTLTPEQERAYVKSRFEQEQALAGPNEAAKAMRAYFTEADAARAQSLEQAKGLGALKAASAILRPGGFMRGLGAAGEAFAESYDKALQADRAEKRALKMAQINLMDAERKEKLGFTRSAMSSLAAYRQNLQKADQLGLNKLRYEQEGAAAVARATRPTAQPKPTAPRAPKEYETAIDTYLPAVKELFPDLSPAQQKARALQMYQERKSPGLEGVQTRVAATAELEARERTQRRTLTDPAFQEAVRKRDAAGQTARRAQILAEEMKKPPSGGGVIKLD